MTRDERRATCVRSVDEAPITPEEWAAVERRARQAEPPIISGEWLTPTRWVEWMRAAATRK